MKIKQLCYGLSSFIPGVYESFSKKTGGSNNARYCYSVWLRHLIIAYENKLYNYPEIIAELGPGASLGVGFAGLLSGANRYYALDAVKHSNIENNLLVFDELIKLFQNRENIPGEEEFPLVKPYLDSYDFPKHILTDELLNITLEKSRIEKIRESIKNINNDDSLIKYIVPWYDPGIIIENTIDMIYSQAVLEYIDDLANAYNAMRLWLIPGGFFSHQIDFKCHGTHKLWNGHWTISNFIWKLIKGKRPFYLNREPHSTHTKHIENQEFKIIVDNKVVLDSEISGSDLTKKFRYLTDDDLITSGTLIQAAKKQ